MDKKYYIGFDIGTESVGWATTDEEYNLLKARGHDFWGTYLFDQAKTAAERRGYRTSRRRFARRRQRIKLLQEIFAQEISKVDFCFFERLNNSKYNVEDKAENVKYSDSLFHDEIFNDKEYFKKYKTIYHLRKAFLDAESAAEIKDVRLLYLAVAHIIKNRGHFLFEGQEFNAGDKDLAIRAFENVNAALCDMDEDKQSLSLDKLDDVFDTLRDKKSTKRDKVKKLKELLGVQKDKTCQEIVNAIVGCKAKTANLFGEGEYEIKDFCFDDGGFELEKVQNAFSEEEFGMICNLKAIYDWAVLAQILGDHQYISQAMCAKFDSHCKDLKMLKDYVKSEFGQAKYNEVFRKQKDLKNYAAYIGKDRNQSFNHASKEDFYKYLKSFVKDETILAKIEEGVFLEKQRTNANGVIPYQVHKAELELILENACANFPFLNEESDGMTVKDKIVKLLTFRIPYYVGPLNTAHAEKGFAWVKKFDGTEHEKVTPWNFDKIVDRQASEDEFIKRMTNKCTYLVGEDVLPKQSLLYSEFAFLNSLKNVSFKGRRLDKQARDAIVDFAKRNGKRNITLKVVGNVLAKAGLIEQSENKVENFAGIDKEIKNGFSTLCTFRRIFGDKFDADKCEEIIKWSTIMGNQEDVAKRAAREFGLDKEIVKQLKGLNFSGWGNLSKRFLDSDDISVVTQDGEILTLIEAMRETDYNLMELLSKQFGFSAAIDRFNAQNADDGAVTYKTVEDLYCSPSVKRAIWRTVCLAREIEKVQGCPPDRIFVEMTRGGDERKKGARTKTRKEQLTELYKVCKTDVIDWVSQDEISDLTKQIESTEDAKFLSDKLYLYYLQMGRCAYTGKPIHIEDLLTKNTCDIDHIYPQSKRKDDSVLNNKVLCYKTTNSDKKDVYPIDADIRKNMLPLWTLWHDKKLINDEKFKRLTRCTPLTQEELADFINRQLVETSQSTKAVAQLLKQMYPDSVIVYSKAKNVTEFKNYINSKGNKNGEKNPPKIVKVRELNDLHHAKDAYLNIVVGNVYYSKFNRDALTYLKENGVDSYNLNKLFDEKLKKGWNPLMTDKVVATVNKNTCRVVRFTSEGKGGLFNATIKVKGANDKLIPLKRNCPLEKIDKYGGYDSATTAYFALVKSADKKGKPQLSLEAIPIYVDLLGKDKVLDYLKNNVALVDPQVMIEKIKINSLLKINGAYVWLRGKHDDARIKICNANELILDHNCSCYLKKIISFMQKQKKLGVEFEPMLEIDLISAQMNLVLYDSFVNKLGNAPYGNLPMMENYYKLMCDGRDVFTAMNMKQQVILLSQILKLFQCNPVEADLTSIGGRSAGALRRSKKIALDEEFLLITQSPTGYYRDTVDLTAFYQQ